MKHKTRLSGALLHAHGRLGFESTPANLTLDILRDDGTVEEELMTLSRHCLPGTGHCLSETDQYVLLTAAPDLRVVTVRGSSYGLPITVDVHSKPAIDAYFSRFRGVCEGQAQDPYACEPWADELTQLTDEQATLEVFFAKYDRHLAALKALYATLYEQHDVTGRSHDSAIPLFVTAMTHASAMGADKPQHERLFEPEPNGGDEKESARYEAFRAVMLSAPSSDDESAARRSLQSFSTNRGINFCMNGGFVTSYTTNWYGWNNCCGSVCGNNDRNTCSGTCGSYSPDCSNSCNGMCGPSCDNCWPGICGDCCLWHGCYDHDNDCASYASTTCFARSVQAVEQQVESFSSRSAWCVDGYKGGGSSSSSSSYGTDTCRCEFHATINTSPALTPFVKFRAHITRWLDTDANDGECDVPSYCTKGTDRSDCCGNGGGNTCRYANDGECDVPSYCTKGTDNTDCCSTGH